MAQAIKVSDSKSEFTGIAFGNAFAASLFGFLQKSQKPIEVETNSTRSASGIYDHSFDGKTFLKHRLSKNEMSEIFQLGNNTIQELYKNVKKLAFIKEDFKCLYDHIEYHSNQFSKVLRLLLNEMQVRNEILKNSEKEREKQIKRCRKYVKHLPGFSYESGDFQTDIKCPTQTKRLKSDLNHHFVLIKSGVVIELSRSPKMVSLSEFWKTVLIKNKLIVLTKIYNLNKNHSCREMLIVIRSLLDVDKELGVDEKILVFSLMQKILTGQGLNPHVLFSGKICNSSVLTKIYSLVIKELQPLITVINDHRDRINCFIGLCSKNGILVPDEITCIDYPN